MNDRMVSRVTATARLWGRFPSPAQGSRKGTRSMAVASWPARPARSRAAMGHGDRATPGRRAITMAGRFRCVRFAGPWCPWCHRRRDRRTPARRGTPPADVAGPPIGSVHHETRRRRTTARQPGPPAPRRGDRGGHGRDRPGGQAGGPGPGRTEHGRRRRPVPRRGGPVRARGGRRPLRAHRPRGRRRREPPGRRRRRPPLRRGQVEPLGCGPRRQQWGPGRADGAPPGSTGLHPLLDHGRLRPDGPPRLRRGRPPGRQPRGVAVPADVQHLQDRRRGHGPLGGTPPRAAHHHRPAVGPLRGQRRVAGRAPGAHAGRTARAGPPRLAQRLPPAPHRRHRGHGPRSRGRGHAGHRRQLGRRRGREHRGVVRRAVRAHRRARVVRTDGPHHRQRADRPHPHARTRRTPDRRLAGRPAPHGGPSPPGTARDSTPPAARPPGRRPASGSPDQLRLGTVRCRQPQVPVDGVGQGVDLLGREQGALEGQGAGAGPAPA